MTRPTVSRPRMKLYMSSGLKDSRWPGIKASFDVTCHAGGSCKGKIAVKARHGGFWAAEGCVHPAGVEMLYFRVSFEMGMEVEAAQGLLY